LKSILDSLQYYGGPVEIIREDFGKVIGTKFNYDLKIIDSRTAPNIIEWGDLSIKNIRDKNLYERIRKGFSVEDYVSNLYSKK